MFSRVIPPHTSVRSIALVARQSVSRVLLALFVLVCLAPTVMSAQVFPTFPAGTNALGINGIQAGVSAFNVPNSVYGNVLMSVMNQGNNLGYAISADGTNNTYGEIFTNANSSIPSMGCNAGEPEVCGAGITVFNGVIYVAYADYTTYGLDVVRLDPIPGNVGYTATTVTQQTATLVTTPSMSVINGLLVIIYGTSNNPSVQHAFYESTFDGTTWTNPDESHLGYYGVSSAATPALSVMNVNLIPTLFMCSQQNNSNHTLYVYSSTDGVNWSFVYNETRLALGSGATMVTINNTLVLATEQNNSQKHLWIFTSPNGTTWNGDQYSGIQMSGFPGIALFTPYNSTTPGYALSFKSLSTTNLLNSFTTSYTTY